MSTPSKISTLVLWSKENGIIIDPRLYIVSSKTAGVGVYSGDISIPPDTTVVQIPKSIVLSARSCTLSHFLPATSYGHDAQLVLAAALYSETLMGPRSRWFGYLQSLPDGIVEIPLFWGAHELGEPLHHVGDEIESLSWLRGTQVLREMAHGDPGPEQLALVRGYFSSHVKPLLLKHKHILGVNSTVPSLHGFYRAYSLVSSRSFLVDAFHGLAMVPIADAFNHTNDHHVHLEADYNVCFQCGSLYECLHDRDEVPANSCESPRSGSEVDPTAGHSSNSIDDVCYDMVTNSFIPPLTEVFNTYGENMSNAQLLSRYGFIIDGNEHDYIAWDVEEIFKFLNARLINVSVDTRPEYKTHNFHTIWESICNFPSDDILDNFSDSSLVFRDDGKRGNTLRLNGDGAISHQLWLLFILFHGMQADSLTLLNDTASIQGTLAPLADLQVHLETGLGAKDLQMKSDSNSLTLFMEASEALIALCGARMRHIGKGNDHIPLGDILDNLTDDMVRTRVAVTVVMSELSILDSCISAWGEMLDTISQWQIDLHPSNVCDGP